MARVLLIKCSFITFFQRALAFPLGIMSISSALRKEGHEVKILDLRLDQRHSDKNILQAIEEFQPHVVGLSSITIESSSLHSTAALVKMFSPGVPVIAGGAHPTGFPEEVLSDKNIDSLVMGEGEATVPELINALLDGGPLKNIKGIAFSQDGHIVFTDPRPLIKDLDSLPFPAWDLVRIEEYKKWQGMSGIGYRRYMNLFTSRACPYQCIYCHKMFGKEFRARSPENVLEEITRLVKDHHVKDFEILDDIFNFDTQRALTFYNLVLRKGLKVSFFFPNGLRCDRIDGDHVKLMRRAGVVHTAVAVETASPRLQKLIRKNLNLERVKAFIEECSKIGIYTRGFFMIGFPTESREELLETIHYAVTSKLNTAFFFIVIPFKGTELSKLYENKLKGMQVDFSHYNYVTGTFNLSKVSDDELFRFQKHAYRKFYVNPRRVARAFLSHPLKRSFPLSALGVLKLLFRQKEGNPLLPRYFTN